MLLFLDFDGVLRRRQASLYRKVVYQSPDWK